MKDLFCVLSIGQDGVERIHAMEGPDGKGHILIAAMVYTDKQTLDLVTPGLRDIAKKSGQRFRLVRFTTMEDLGEIKP